jgi:uncharacterized protein (UPF0332 family)
MKEDVLAWWARALDTLHAAELLVSASPDNAASRAYYAAHHALSAHFLLAGAAYIKHSALEAAVHRELVRPGIWTIELGKNYSELVRLRGHGDYGGTIRVLETEAREAVQKARRILCAVQRMHPDIFIPEDTKREEQHGA